MMKKNRAIPSCVAIAAILALAFGAHAQEVRCWAEPGEYSTPPACPARLAPPDSPPSWLYSAWDDDRGPGRPLCGPRPSRPLVYTVWVEKRHPIAFIPLDSCDWRWVRKFERPVWRARPTWRHRKPPATVEVSTWNEPLFGYPCATVVKVATRRPRRF